MKNYYSILGVSKSASADEIKKAFRKLAHQHHPDKSGGDEAKFKEINEAYQVLSSQEKRSQYDQFGSNFDQFGGGSGNTQGFDFGSFWQNGSADFSDIFEGIFNNGPSRERNINRGRDIEVGLNINLEDTLKDFEKEINLAKLVACKRCDGLGTEPGTKLKECVTCRGTGRVKQMRKTILGTITRAAVCPECKGEGRIPEKPCNVCSGEGRIEGEEKIKVNIPAGVDTGQVIEVPNMGEAGKRGDEAGDLYIKVFVKPHPSFERKGDDLLTEQDISFSQAVLGGEAEIDTLEGKKLVLKVSERTESGKILKISNKGIPHFSGWGRGNLFVELNISIPKKLTKKQKQVLKELEEQGL